MADEDNMGAERFIKTPYDAAKQPAAELGYSVPKIKLEGGRQDTLSVPTRERMAQLQEADTTGHIVIVDPLSSVDEQDLDAVKQKLAQETADAKKRALLLAGTKKEDEDDAEDKLKTFPLGTRLRKAQGIVLGMARHIKSISGFGEEDIDRLLTGLSSSETREATVKEIETGLTPVYEALRSSSVQRPTPRTKRNNPHH